MIRDRDFDSCFMIRSNTYFVVASFRFTSMILNHGMICSSRWICQRTSSQLVRVSKEWCLFEIIFHEISTVLMKKLHNQIST